MKDELTLNRTRRESIKNLISEGSTVDQQNYGALLGSCLGLIVLKVAQVTLDGEVGELAMYVQGTLCAVFGLGVLFLWVGFRLKPGKCRFRIESLIIVMNYLVLYFIVFNDMYLELYCGNEARPGFSNDTFILGCFVIYYCFIDIKKWVIVVNLLLLSMVNLGFAIILHTNSIGSTLAGQGLLFLFPVLITKSRESLYRPRVLNHTGLSAEFERNELQNEFHYRNLEQCLFTCDYIIETLTKTLKLPTSSATRRRLKNSIAETRKIKQYLVHGDLNDYIPDQEMNEEDMTFCRENYTKRSTSNSHFSVKYNERRATLLQVLKSPTLQVTDLDTDLNALITGAGQVWNFNVWMVHEVTGHSIVSIGNYLIENWQICREFSISQRIVDSFLKELESSYEDNPYHNACHASDVLCSLIYFITHSQLMEQLTLQEVLACFIAALGHDIGHPGMTNRYLVKSRHQLALQYNDISVLENMHSYLTFSLMKGESDILKSLSEEVYEAIRRLVVEMILSTDMSNHFEHYARFKGKLFTNSLSMGNAKDRAFILSIGIKCADIGHSAKELAIHQQWTKLITQEFFHQGDLEKAQGLPVSMYFDRENTSIPKSQIGFLRHVCFPLFDEWCKYLNSKIIESDCISQLKNNILYWESLDIPKIEDKNSIESTPC